MPSWIPEKIEYVNVNDMYKFSQLNNTTLLSSYGSDFWADYRANSARYDSLFARMFKSYRYYDQESNEDVEDVQPRFTEQVYNHLLMNDKRYSELWRIWSISDTSYSITDGYKFSETQRSIGESDKEESSGERIDENERTNGARTNIIIDSKDAIERTDTDTVQGFNSSTWQDSNKTESVTDARTDRTTENIGSNTVADVYTKGEQNDTKHEEHDNTTTIERTGNIGGESVTDILRKHDKFWNSYSFYKTIFADICKELLLV